LHSGTTTVAQALDFQHLPRRRKIMPVGRLGHQILDLYVAQLSHRPALQTDQKLAGMSLIRVGTADVGVQ
jgi:hypothetical protein